MSNTNLLEGLATVEQIAADFGKNPATITRWMNAPNGLPYVRLGRKRYVHVDTARQWILSRMRRPNPTRRTRSAARNRSFG